MRRLLVAALAAVALAPDPAEARTRERAKCFPRGVEEVVRSRETRVFRGRDETIACNYATGRRRLLGSEIEGLYVYPPPRMDLSGTVVGYHLYDASDPVSNTYDSVRVLDVRSGRELSQSGTYGGGVGSLQVTARGSLAWIAGGGSDTTAWRLLRGATAERLDTGAGIHARSLGLRGTALSWIHDGERRRAELR